MKTKLFARQAYKKRFLFYTLIAMVILQSELGLIWTIPWPDEKDLFLKFSKIRNLRNSENSVWKTNNFCLDKQWQKFFFSYTLPTRGYSMSSFVWFEQLVNQMKKNYF